jgi:hypothetical protein
MQTTKSSKSAKTTQPAVVVPPQATQLSYSLNPAAKPNPRTNAQSGQASNTQAAWQAVAACILANNGVATHAQLTEALAAVGLQFKTYVPYFTTRCKWLVVAK